MRIKAFCLAAVAASWAAAPPLWAQSAMSPSDPLAQVPAFVYRSVFDAGGSNDANEKVDWKKANDEVGQFRRGHIDVLKWEEQTAPAKDGTTQPARATQGTTGIKP